MLMKTKLNAFYYCLAILLVGCTYLCMPVFSIDVQGTTNPRPSLILVATE